VKLEPHFSKRHDLSIKLATTEQQLRIAQRLRYHVFYEEMGALGTANNNQVKADCDKFDDVCDHLLVMRARTENSNPELCLANEEVVGTYRMLRQAVAKDTTGFYSQNEFDLQPLLERKADLSFLELGRSCVFAPYRGTAVIELLWQGIWNYARHHKIDVMFGCASFDGTNPETHADALSFLSHQPKTPHDWQVRAHANRYVEMKCKPIDAVDRRRAMLSLPPLIKGYLRLGSYIGEGAVVDHDFNTTDILVVLPVSAINPRYFAHFGAPTS
jgi:L-ornithine Nalpha-acyltransferase